MNRKLKIIKVFCWNKIKEISFFIAAIIVVVIVLFAMAAVAVGIFYSIGYLLLLIPPLLAIHFFIFLLFLDYQDLY